MGIFRTLYREARAIAGLKPPAENETQLAERVCGEIKSEFGGKKLKQGDDWLLTMQRDDRKVEILFMAAGTTVLFTLGSTLESGPQFVVTQDPTGKKSPAEPGLERVYVTSAGYLEGSKAEVAEQNKLWTVLPTGTRANLGGVLQKGKGAFGYDEGVFKYAPDAPMLMGSGGKDQVKTTLKMLLALAGEIERAWNAL